MDKEEEAKVAGQNPVEHGKSLYQANCASCHSIDGSQMACPTWKGLYGANREFTNAGPVKADENYLKESIYYPTRKLLKAIKTWQCQPTYIYLKKKLIILLNTLRRLNRRDKWLKVQII